MKTQPLFRQSVAAICLAGALSLSPAAARAQSEPTNPPGPFAALMTKKFDLDISAGAMMYKGKRVQATIQNLVAYLRDQDADLNVVVAPGVGDIVIGDLKLHNADLGMLINAVRVATDGAVNASGSLGGGRRGGGGGGVSGPFGSGESQSLMLVRGGPRGDRQVDRQVEVFNLSGYLRRNGKENEADVNKSLQQIQEIIVGTLENLRQGEAMKGWQPPRFVFHAGANLFIVIGSSEDIEVARKVVNALESPGGRGGRGGGYGVPGGSGGFGGGLTTPDGVPLPDGYGGLTTPDGVPLPPGYSGGGGGGGRSGAAGFGGGGGGGRGRPGPGSLPDSGTNR